jgi:hypothetical protein
MADKLMDVLNAAAPTREPTEFERDLQTLLTAPAVIGTTIKYQVNTVAAMAAKHGLDNLLAALPDDVRAAFIAGLAAVQTFWEANSSELFPAMPAQPVPVDGGTP